MQLMTGKWRPWPAQPSARPRPGRRAARLGAGLLILVIGCHDSVAGARQAVAAAAVRSQQARDLARQAGLAPDVQSFMARAAGAGAATFSVVYDLGRGQRSVVMQRPPDRRVDIEGMGGPATLDRYLFTTAGTYSCHRDQGPWSCQRGGDAPAIGAFSPDTIGQTVAALSQSTTTYDFTVQTRRIAAVAASCLVTTLKPDHPADPSLGVSGSLCVAPSGAILAIQSTTNSVTALHYSSTVPGGAFSLPARITAGP